MSNNRVWITKKFEFSASHRYWRDDWTAERNEAVFGLCTSPHGHGHNYELHVTVSGDVDPDTGMIINLTELKKKVQVVLENFDHKYLNLDNPHFKNRIPTTENIGLVLFEQIAETLRADLNFKLKKIRLYERSDLYVDVWEQE